MCCPVLTRNCAHLLSNDVARAFAALCTGALGCGVNTIALLKTSFTSDAN